MIIIVKHKHGIELLILSAAGDLLYSAIVLEREVSGIIEGAQDATDKIPDAIAAYIERGKFAAGFKVYVYDMRVTAAKKK